MNDVEGDIGALATEAMNLLIEGCDFSASFKPGRPHVAAVDVDVAQAVLRVELPGQDGVTDRGAPQHAGITGVGIVVGQLADRAGDFDQRLLVVEVRQRHGCCPHQRSVARGAARVFVQCR
jgi:hypothetical protein